MKVKALVLRGVKDLHVEEIPVRDIRDDEALVKVNVCGVCGTDVHMWAGTNKEGTFPFVPGHEMIGVVEAVGKNVTSIKEGDRVTGECVLGCRVCTVCREGAHGIFCPNFRYYGFTWETGGAFSEYHISPEERLHKVPDSVDDETAALTEGISVAYQAIWGRGGGVGPHDRVAIFGAGPIGIFAMTTCLVAEADVIVVEPAPYRQQMARDMGAKQIVDPSKGNPVEEIMDLTNGWGVDKIIECSGSSAGIAMSVDVIAVDGKIVLTGQSVGTKIPIEIGKTIWKHAKVIGSCDSPKFFPKSLRYMEKGLVDFTKVVTHRFVLDDCDKPFDLGNKGTDSGKIMIYPNEIPAGLDKGW